jgi:tRNA (guanine-N7-)-methyltransferase
MTKQFAWNLPFLKVPSWRHLFGNDSPLELEIGMGRSHFLFERAKAVFDHNIIGIEWKGEWVRQARKRAEREGIRNIQAIYGNAWQIVPYIFESESLDQIILNFPDPWWKKKHHKRKVINDDFVDILASKLRVGGRIYLATDVHHLFEEYVERLESHERLFNLAGPGQNYGENPQQARSHREKKCVADGAPIYRAWVEKR